MAQVPSNGNTLKQSGLPLGIIIQPMADICDGEEEVPLGSIEAEGPFRCKKCGSYANPGFQFVDGGQTLVCNMCGTSNPAGGTSYAFNPSNRGQYAELS